MAIPYRYRKKLIAIGNSIFVCVPNIWCKAHNVTKGKAVIVEVYSDKIVITLEENGKSKS